MQHIVSDPSKFDQSLTFAAGYYAGYAAAQREMTEQWVREAGRKVFSAREWADRPTAAAQREEREVTIREAHDAGLHGAGVAGCKLCRRDRAYRAAGGVRLRTCVHGVPLDEKCRTCPHGFRSMDRPLTEGFADAVLERYGLTVADDPVHMGTDDLLTLCGGAGNMSFVWRDVTCGACRNRVSALCLDVAKDASHATLAAAAHIDGITYVEVISGSTQSDNPSKDSDSESRTHHNGDYGVAAEPVPTYVCAKFVPFDPGAPEHGTCGGCGARFAAHKPDYDVPSADAKRAALRDAADGNRVDPIRRAGGTDPDHSGR